MGNKDLSLTPKTGGEKNGSSVSKCERTRNVSNTLKRGKGRGKCGVSLETSGAEKTTDGLGN